MVSGLGVEWENRLEKKIILFDALSLAALSLASTLLPLMPFYHIAAFQKFAENVNALGDGPWEEKRSPRSPSQLRFGTCP